MNMDTTPLEAGLDYFIKFDKVRPRTLLQTFNPLGLLPVGTQKLTNLDCTRSLRTYYNIPSSLLCAILFLYIQARVFYKITET